MNYTLTFQQIDKTSLPLVGGKGANLGEMSAAGFPVPQGFCVTTEAFNRFVSTSPLMEELYRELDELNVDDLGVLRKSGESVRRHVTGVSARAFFLWSPADDDRSLKAYGNFCSSHFFSLWQRIGLV